MCDVSILSVFSSHFFFCPLVVSHPAPSCSRGYLSFFPFLASVCHFESEKKTLLSEELSSRSSQRRCWTATIQKSELSSSLGCP